MVVPASPLPGRGSFIVADSAERPNPIDPNTAAFIRRKASQLIRQNRLANCDQDDLEQDLTLELLKRLPAFDPSKGKREPFVYVLLKNAAADLQRRLMCARKCKQLGEQAIDDPAERLAELARDVESVLARLPDDLKAIAELLKNRSVSDAARELGIPRTTLNDRVRALRERFEKAGLRDYLATISVT
jgi:RNA polymerase sigma-70 factor, ECF subfamily